MIARNDLDMGGRRRGVEVVGQGRHGTHHGENGEGESQKSVGSVPK